MGSPVGRLLGGFDQHPTQCGRRRKNLRGFHDARTITIKDGIGQVADLKDRNCGGTWELDYLGGGLRGWLRGWARFGDAGSSGGGFFFVWAGEALPGPRERGRTRRRPSPRRSNSRRSSWRRGVGP